MMTPTSRAVWELPDPSSPPLAPGGVGGADGGKLGGLGGVLSFSSPTPGAIPGVNTTTAPLSLNSHRVPSAADSPAVLT